MSGQEMDRVKGQVKDPKRVEMRGRQMDRDLGQPEKSAMN